LLFCGGLINKDNDKEKKKKEDRHKPHGAMQTRPLTPYRIDNISDLHRQCFVAPCIERNLLNSDAC